MSPTVSKETSVAKGLELMKKENVSELPIVEKGAICGLFSQTTILEKILSGEASMSSPAASVAVSTFRHVTSRDTIGKAARIVQNNGYVFVVDENQFVATLHRDDIFDAINAQN